MNNLFDVLQKKPVRVDKSWGYELIFANDENNNYCGKILHINKGSKFSMHFHRIKAETFYILSGEVRVSLLDLKSKDGDVHSNILSKGECLELPLLQPHQVEALEESEIIEASNFHEDEDSYRIWR